MSRDSSPSTILVAVDGSPESDAAIAWAANESAIRRAPVNLMYVIPPARVDWPIDIMLEPPEWYDKIAREILERAKKTFQTSWRGTSSAHVETTIGNGRIVPVLSDASKDAHMVVTGSRGRGALHRLLIGSVSNGLLHHAHCPVAVIPSDRPSVHAGAPVVVGIDGSPSSEAATALAFDEADRRGVDLVALHAWNDFGAYLGVDVGADTEWRQYEIEAHEVLAERLAGWQEQYPDVAVHRRIVCNEPAYWLTEESRRAQLVVVGSRGRGGFTGLLLGSTSSAVVQVSSAPVIVARR